MSSPSAVRTAAWRHPNCDRVYLFFNGKLEIVRTVATSLLPPEVCATQGFYPYSTHFRSITIALSCTPLTVSSRFGFT